MDKELKQRWVEALRSGKYQQTQLVLKKQEGGTCSFCCLGVLADIIDPDGWENDNDVGYFDHPLKHEDDNILKHSILHEHDQYVLTGYNDDENYDFNMIADYIERTL